MDFGTINRFQESRIDLSQCVALATALCAVDLDALNDEERRDLSARVAELRTASAALARKFGEPPSTPTRHNVSRYLAGDC